uniref:Uncharacterized protein n=1 Tax=Timema cristinae TaxID=61476 RepID=A0A7R9H3Y5_TIMCR|nr:unnamed protein product [Timema cristinae]
MDRGAEFITSTIKVLIEASTPRHCPKRAPQASLPDYILRHVRGINRLRKALKILRNPVDKANWSHKVHLVREMVKEYWNSTCWREADTWRTNINLEKSTATLFTWKRKFYRLAPLRMFGEQIRWVEIVDYLGLTLDTKLTWRQHCIERHNKTELALPQCPCAKNPAQRTSEVKKRLFTPVSRLFPSGLETYGRFRHVWIPSSCLFSLDYHPSPCGIFVLYSVSCAE